MILTNTETVPGKRIVEHFGVVSGSTVRAKHIGKDIWAGFKNIVGGEMKGYTESSLTMRQQIFISLVCILWRTKSRKLPHCPQSAVVHRGMNSSGKRETSRKAQVFFIFKVLNIEGGIEFFYLFTRNSCARSFIIRILGK